LIWAGVSAGSIASMSAAVPETWARRRRRRRQKCRTGRGWRGAAGNGRGSVTKPLGGDVNARSEQADAALTIIGEACHSIILVGSADTNDVGSGEVARVAHPRGKEYAGIVVVVTNGKEFAALLCEDCVRKHGLDVARLPPYPKDIPSRPAPLQTRHRYTPSQRTRWLEGRSRPCREADDDAASRAGS
jgi:hypothetical protein